MENGLLLPELMDRKKISNRIAFPFFEGNRKAGAIHKVVVVKGISMQSNSYLLSVRIDWNVTQRKRIKLYID